MENQSELQNLNIIDATPANYPDYIKRPTIGCRALVRRSLKVLDVVLHEMEDWKDEVRLQSTKLLMHVVIHSEDHVASKYFDINAVLCKTCADQEVEIAKQALDVAKLIGHFVDSVTWSKYIFEELKVRQGKLGILKCMNEIFQHSSCEKRFDCLLELSEILLDTSICHNNQEPFQLELMKLLQTLIAGAPYDSKIHENFYVIALKSTAASFDNEVIRGVGVAVVDQLSNKSSSDIHQNFLKPALDTLDLPEQVDILYGIICLRGFQVSFSFILLSNFLRSPFLIITRKRSSTY
jgi:dynein assembly factor 5, axonemal